MQPDKASTPNESQPREPGRSNDYNESRRYGATETRPGLMGRPVLAVLLAGLVLALVVWAAVEYWGPGTYRDTNTGGATTSEVPAPATSDAPASPPSANPAATAPSTTEPPANPATDGTPQTEPTQPNNANGATGSAPAPQAP